METKYIFKKILTFLACEIYQKNSFRLDNYNKIYDVKFILNLSKPSDYNIFANYYWEKKFGKQLDISYYYKRFNNSDFLNNLFNYAKENDFSGFLILIPFYNELLVQHIEVKFCIIYALFIFVHGGNFCSFGNCVK